MRNVSLVVLTGFLFAILLCAFENSTLGHSEDHHGETAHHSHVDNHTDHGHGVQQAGECCSVFASVTTPTHATDFSLAIYCLLGVLTLSFIGRAIISIASIKTQFNCAGPPGASQATLIANCLWPHAPPR